jgi:hypothetical protein
MCVGLGGGDPIHAATGDAGLLQQDAPRGKLYVDPALPDWLPDVTLTDLRGAAALRYPLLAGRPGHGFRGAEGEARRGGEDEHGGVWKRQVAELVKLPGESSPRLNAH